MKASIVILAAGKGTRMHSDLPKVLHQICGKPLLFFIIQEALKISDDIHVVIAHQAPLLKEAILQHFDETIHFHQQDLQHFPGTGGALMDGNQKKPFEMLYQRVLILNGDMPLIQAPEMHKILESKAKIVLSAITLKDPSGYGRILMQEGRVVGIVEQKDCSPQQSMIKEVNAGVYAMDKEVLEEFLPTLKNHNAQHEYYLTDLIAFGVQRKYEIDAVFGDEATFMGVNSKFDLANAQEVMLHRIRKKAMLNGVIMHLPHTIYLEDTVEFQGSCEIQEGVRIEGKSLIQDSIIKSHSIIENSQVINSSIGPLAHIRPKSKISQTHIGNFVEVKASCLDGVKAGHLSYLGDCQIGEGSNVGAGVITCNYDGIRKHQTHIGKNVFIGSDVQLIAPLRIESNVLIGAGSTICKDCCEGDLALSRVEQKNIPKGFYRFFKKD